MQRSVLQVMSSDIDGINHNRHSCCAGFGCWLFSQFSCYLRGLLLYQVIEVFTKKSGVLYTYYFIHIFTETNKILL